jgi:hypothetical protein
MSGWVRKKELTRASSCPEKDMSGRPVKGGKESILDLKEAREENGPFWGH